MTKKIKNIFAQIWDWFMYKGVWGTIITLGLIYMVVFALCMSFLRWLLNKY